MQWTHPKPAIRGLGLFVVIVGFGLSFWQFGRHQERNSGREAALAQQTRPALAPNEVPQANDAWREGNWSGRFQPPVVLIAGRSVGGERAYGVVGVVQLQGGDRLAVDFGTVTAENAAALVASNEAGLPYVVVDSVPPGVVALGGLVRLAGGNSGIEPVEGHGTRVWAGESWASIVPALGSTLGVYVTRGDPGGGYGNTSGSLSLIYGFEPVPPYDETSWYYAWQWAAIAVLGLLAAAPRPRIKTKMDAR